MSLGQLEVLFCRVVIFKFESENENFPACIKDALVDACDQFEEHPVPRMDERREPVAKERVWEQIVELPAEFRLQTASPV